MINTNNKEQRRNAIRKRIRRTVIGVASRPRLSVFRSNHDIYAQIIDDTKGITLVSCSSRIKDLSLQPVSKVDKSKMVGKLLAERAIQKGIDKVVFDRGGYLFHGRVKALAEGAREGGLQF